MEIDDQQQQSASQEPSADRAAPVAATGDPRVVVLGAGFVGLASAIALSPPLDKANSRSFRVTVLDTDPQRVAHHRRDLSNGANPLGEFSMHDALTHAGVSFEILDDTTTTQLEGAVVVCAVGTPAGGSRVDALDCRHVLEAAALAAKHRAAIFVLRSTIFPDALPSIRRALGDVPLMVVPEFLREGHAVYDAHFPSRVVIGTVTVTPIVAWVRSMMARACQVFTMLPEEAVIVKLASNAALSLRAWHCSIVGDACERVDGADARRVLAAVYADTRLGTPGTPGLGAGGPCLPKDAGAFGAMAGGTGGVVMSGVMGDHATRPARFATRISRWTGPDRSGKVVQLGIGFKPDSSDWRSSPALRLVQELLVHEFRVDVWDPRIPIAEWTEIAQHIKSATGWVDVVERFSVPGMPTIDAPIDVIVLCRPKVLDIADGVIRGICGVPLLPGRILADPYALLTAEDRSRLPPGTQYIGGGTGL